MNQIRTAMAGTLVLALASGVACDGDSDGAGGDTMSAATGADDGTGALADTGADESTGAPGMEIDADAIAAAAVDYAMTVQINDEARASQHALGKAVNMWVEADVAELYASIDPAAEGAEVEFPPGTTLYKEHLDDAGEFNGLTIMFKGPAGYNAAAADWWWGRTDKNFTLADQGKVSFCIDCHAAASASGYVFGVPLDNRK